MKSKIHELLKKANDKVVSKKLYALLFLGVLHTATAQVPNSTFESATGYALTDVASWGKFYPIQISIDPENGESMFDEITFGDGSLGTFCISELGDAHTGARSMLIRNAFNVTQNTIIPGSAELFNSQISAVPTGWNAGVPVEEDAQIWMFGFWYKFAPLGNDMAEGTLELFGESGNLVGKASVPISGFDNQFQYVYTPIDFMSNESPVFMTISFSMAAEGSTPVFGSTLKIDDVRVNFLPLGVTENETQLFTVYPTVASHDLNIVKNGASESSTLSLSIIDMTGKTVKKQTVEMANSQAIIDISALANGTYILAADAGNERSVTRFIKK